MKFCTYCGKELPENGVCSCPDAVKVEGAKARKAALLQPKNLLKIGIPLVVVVLAIIAVTSIVSYNKMGIDLNDYLVIDGASGLNGYGVVSYHLDEDALTETMFGDHKEVTEDNWEEAMTENAAKYQQIGNALECITVSASPAESLSNGDEVTVTAVFDNTKGYEIDHHFKNGEKTITVSGLPEPKTVDPLADENISLTFDGFSGFATATLDVKPTEGIMAQFTYSLSKNAGLCNGDTVTVSVSFNKEKLEDEGYLPPETTEKRFAVSGLPEYLTSADAISVETLTDIQEKSVEYSQAREMNEYGTITVPSAVIRTFFLSSSVPGATYTDFWKGIEFSNAIVVVTQYTYEYESFFTTDTSVETNIWLYPNWTKGDNGVSYDEDKETRYYAYSTEAEELQAMLEVEFRGMNVSAVS